MNVKQFHVIECWGRNTMSSVQEHGGSLLLLSGLKVNLSDDVTIQNDNIAWNQVHHGILFEPPLNADTINGIEYRLKSNIFYFFTFKRADSMEWNTIWWL